MERCPCGGDNLDRFIQPVILSILANESRTGYAVVKKIRDYPAFAVSWPDPRE